MINEVVGIDTAEGARLVMDMAAVAVARTVVVEAGVTEAVGVILATVKDQVVKNI